METEKDRDGHLFTEVGVTWKIEKDRDGHLFTEMGVIWKIEKDPDGDRKGPRWTSFYRDGDRDGHLFTGEKAAMETEST